MTFTTRDLYKPLAPAISIPGLLRLPKRLPQLNFSLFIASISTLIALMLLLPIFYLLIRSTTIGIRAFDYLFQWRTLQITFNSVGLAISVTLSALVISLPLAWLTVRTNLPGRRVWSVLSILPLVFPSFIGSFAILAMLGPKGIAQGWLAPIGIERLPSIYGYPGAVSVLTLFTYPYVLLSIRAGLRNQDPSIEEAARNLGYSAWKAFWHITLPSLRPSIIAGSLLVSLYVISDFGAVAMLRYNSFTRAIYMQYSASFDRSLASLLALVLVLMTISILVISKRMQGKQHFYRSSSGTPRACPPVDLGRWKWPALLFCTLIVTVALFAPMAVVTHWLIRGLLAGESLQPLMQSAFQSLEVSSITAFFAILLAAPIVFFGIRYPSRFSGLVGRSTYVGYGLPGIVIALSLVFFGANYFNVAYQTIFILIFAYIVRFLPQAIGSLRSNMLQISPRLEEAARSLGLNQQQAMCKVTLPLLRPGIWSGAALVFLTTIKELPATLLLGPTGFSTLATQIWSATEEAFFARAAAPALLLLCLSALSITIILKQEERAQGQSR